MVFESVSATRNFFVDPESLSTDARAATYSYIYKYVSTTIQSELDMSIPLQNGRRDGVATYRYLISTLAPIDSEAQQAAIQ